MHILPSIKKLNHRISIIFYPILFDFIALIIGWSFIGLQSSGGPSIKLILEMGIPSVSHISEIPLFVNHVDFLNLQEVVSLLMLLTVFVMIMIRAFLQGGYINYLYHIITDQKYTVRNFFNFGRRNWIQLFLLEIIIYLAKIAITAFLVIFFNIIGVFAAFAFIMFIRIVYIYLEFAIVIDRQNISSGFRKSWHYLKNSMFPSFPLMFVMYLISGLLSFLLHKYWSLPFIIGLVFVYSYILTVFQLAFMTIFNNVKSNLYR